MTIGMTDISKVYPEVLAQVTAVWEQYGYEMVGPPLTCEPDITRLPCVCRRAFGLLLRPRGMTGLPVIPRECSMMPHVTLGDVQRNPSVRPQPSIQDGRKADTAFLACRQVAPVTVQATSLGAAIVSSLASPSCG